MSKNVPTEGSIDMGQVAPAESTSFKYLEPGMYRLKVDTESVRVDTPQGKTPYLSVRYLSESGASVVEKFYLTPKAIARLQYYYMALTGKKLDKVFSSYVEIGQYFEKLLKSKPLTFPMVVGGKITVEGKLYSNIKYTDFIIPANVDFEEGAFEKDSANYKDVVRYDKPNPAVANTDATVLPGTGYVPIAGAEDLPW